MIRYGYFFADKVIETITNKIGTIFRDTDVLGRPGGDEFIVFMANVKDADTARAKGAEIGKLIRSMVFEENPEYRATLSVDIKLSKENDTFQAMYQRADEALYAVKKK